MSSYLYAYTYLMTEILLDNCYTALIYIEVLYIISFRPAYKHKNNSLILNNKVRLSS